MSNVQQLRQPKLKPPRTRPLRDLFADTNQTRKPLLGEWMREGHLCMVYAPTGVGKSFFAMSCAIAIAGGGEAFGWTAPKPRPVLLVDGEMDREDITDRARLLIPAAPGADAEKVADNLHVMAYQDQDVNTWFPNIAEPEGQACIVDMARKTGARLVILDNFSTLAQVEDENAAGAIDPIVELMRQLKRIGCAVLLVHHSRKGGKVGINQDGAYRGSSKIAVTFQSIIRLNAPEDHDLADGVAFVFKFEKVRGMRTDETATKRAHLPAVTGTTSGTPRWRIETDEDPQLMKLLRLVRSREYGTQAELATALGVSTGTMSTLKKTALEREMITLDVWQQCLREAKELAQEDATGPDPVF
jgi:RecA-family ATPase/DNA-binding XRE family transcriptional regulator